MENCRLPKSEAARSALAAEIGADGQHLLAALDAAAADRPDLARLPRVAILRQLWASQFVAVGGRMRLGEAAELPPAAEQICLPPTLATQWRSRQSTTRAITSDGYWAWFSSVPERSLDCLPHARQRNLR